jgi:hypothetical protein
MIFGCLCSKSTSPDFKKTLVIPANLVFPGSFINFNVYDVALTTASAVTRLGYVVLPIDSLLRGMHTAYISVVCFSVTVSC